MSTPAIIVYDCQGKPDKSDKASNGRVYELYGLTEEEIAIVEGRG